MIKSEIHILTKYEKFLLMYLRNHNKRTCKRMVELKTKILIKTNQIGYGLKLAAQLKKMGLNAVVSSSFKQSSNEKYKVILMDYEDDNIPKPEPNTQIMVLTNDDDPSNYVVHKDGVLFISKALETDSICSMIEFYVTDQPHRSDIEHAATGIIRRMGIPMKMKGYYFLRTAIVCAIEMPDLIYNITTDLYDKVAEIHNTNRLNVERNIRTVIDNAYDRNPELLLDFFPYTVGKPSNADVIALITDNIRMGIF